MSERVWHKGPPRFIGWWNASIHKDEECWRWWDGSAWSEAAYEEYSPGLACLTASKTKPNKKVEWTDYWPENARVPRLDPTGGHWTFNVDGKEPNYEGPVDLAFRSGFKAPKTKILYGWVWSIEGRPGDIVAWRPAA